MSPVGPRPPPPLLRCEESPWSRRSALSERDLAIFEEALASDRHVSVRRTWQPDMLPAFRHQAARRGWRQVAAMRIRWQARLHVWVPLTRTAPFRLRLQDDEQSDGDPKEQKMLAVHMAAGDFRQLREVGLVHRRVEIFTPKRQMRARVPGMPANPHCSRPTAGSRLGFDTCRCC